MDKTHIVQRDEHTGDNLPLLYQLVYCSRAAPGIDDVAVAQILETAHRCNPPNGITGLLVFGSGVFFQWLEGPRDNITLLMERLHADSRHDTIVTLSHSEEPRERLFPEWDMELVSADEIQDVLLDALSSTDDVASLAAVRVLLQKVESAQASDPGH
jgi:hypothetical protein